VSAFRGRGSSITSGGSRGASGAWISKQELEALLAAKPQVWQEHYDDDGTVRRCVVCKGVRV
jgi:hypothetical protein